MRRLFCFDCFDCFDCIVLTGHCFLLHLGREAERAASTERARSLSLGRNESDAQVTSVQQSFFRDKFEKVNFFLLGMAYPTTKRGRAIATPSFRLI